MKKADIILIVGLLIVAITTLLIFRNMTNASSLTDGIAYVYYNDEKIMGIDLVDGSYDVYIPNRIIEIDEDNFTYRVEGSNPYGVLIK